MADLEPLAMVVAVARNRVIGADNALPWHVPEDMAHFRRVTKGHALIMGRRTHESIGRPLPKRRNIVISRDRTLRIEGCEVAPDLQTAIQMAREHDPEPRVIGGAQIYALALPLTTRLFITEIDRDVEGDSFFPELREAEWREEERREQPGVVWRTLVRS